MARRKKQQMSIEEELVSLDRQIEETTEALKALKSKRKELAQKKEREDLKKLYDKIKSSGRTVEDVLAQMEE